MRTHFENVTGRICYGLDAGGEERRHKKDSMILGLSNWKKGVTIKEMTERLQKY